jgi:hypothetical protein
MTKSFAFFVLTCFLLGACAHSRFKPVEPVKPQTDWAVAPLQQADRSFEKPYEAPQKIYEAFRNAASDGLTITPDAPSIANSPAMEPPAALYDNHAAAVAAAAEAQAAPNVAALKSQLSTKQLKKLDKLQTKIDKRFQQKGDGFGSWWTKWTIIIAIIAGAGLLLFLLGGGLFGLFLFILAGAALVCKLTGILDF